MGKLLEITNLKTYFKTREGWVHAVDGVSFSINEGEKLGVVGRTGVVSGPHLYFEMILGGKPIDPAPYLRLAFCHGDGLSPPVRTTAK